MLSFLSAFSKVLPITFLADIDCNELLADFYWVCCELYHEDLIQAYPGFGGDVPPFFSEERTVMKRPHHRLLRLPQCMLLLGLRARWFVVVHIPFFAFYRSAGKMVRGAYHSLFCIISFSLIWLQQHFLIQICDVFPYDVYGCSNTSYSRFIMSILLMFNCLFSLAFRI